ncbi:dynamin family protein [Shewanella sp. 1CM18E]|uniref:dynamin family protein n=1 Tax=Shewanella sp. 1CM18E TaxID=2929169 RepID=UPI0020BF27F9|nr:dynamin family protein [Shewanella sp. 1CM18E]MCK8045338.1 dynamin family protein [Shewanella sp. 1CM18E]
MSKSSKTILIVATMSAGKSSLINALLGKELLHSANEATTAKLTKITISEKGSPKATAYSSIGIVADSINHLCTNQLKEWNKSEAISSIDIHFPYSESKSSAKLAGYTLIDTPGANNSMDTRHREAFIEAITLYPQSTLLYVLNATQQGTTDDAEMLKVIKDLNPFQKIIFALNKIDELDEERGESIKHYVGKAKQYLCELGFKKPVIVPLMALPALIANKSLSKVEIGRRERNILNSELIRFRDLPHNLNQAAAIPYRLKRNLRWRLNKVSKNKQTQMSEKELKTFVEYTGLRTLKSLIS